jgi:hypothetical protein
MTKISFQMGIKVAPAPNERKLPYSLTEVGAAGAQSAALFLAKAPVPCRQILETDTPPLLSMIEYQELGVEKATQLSPNRNDDRADPSHSRCFSSNSVF